jgi:hypothetical protein
MQRNLLPFQVRARINIPGRLEVKRQDKEGYSEITEENHGDKLRMSHSRLLESRHPVLKLTLFVLPMREHTSLRCSIEVQPESTDFLGRAMFASCSYVNLSNLGRSVCLVFSLTNLTFL